MLVIPRVFAMKMKILAQDLFNVNNYQVKLVTFTSGNDPVIGLYLKDSRQGGSFKDISLERLESFILIVIYLARASYLILLHSNKKNNNYNKKSRDSTMISNT